ncbi:glutamate-5-semialdehyde dehydrogenase [Gigaspora margarita]|uniref:glutamate-5-semialdehyde dehydrogenase n=1 Tax=Gigaspora margarita TaxID=4874 RepID=A0A8H3XMS3_GIGMA|nr:glutamate-5-semialdehyde dehydrogenase [Gigaspora margarita]
MDSLTQIAINARKASIELQNLTAENRSFALNKIKTVLENKKRNIFKANEQDKQNADQLVKDGTLSASLFKRLDLESGDKFATMLQGISDIDRLPDPIEQITYSSKLDEGLELYRVTCPVGVLLVIFEARPEVVVNITALAIKSGNAVILKGGKESILTLTALSSAIQSALSYTAIPPNAIQLVETRGEIDALLDMDKYIDLVIPRGSNSLVKYIQGRTRIPVLGHADGLCTVYVDEDSDLNKAIRVVIDSKVNYPAACNAAETLLIHRSILSSHLLPLVTALQSNNVLLHLDKESMSQLRSPYDTSRIQLCVPENFDTEFLDLEMAVKVVNDVEEAIQHINSHGSKHTDAIVTENEHTAERFMRCVDAAGVYWNASTRFADGFRYGFGAEVGVSTNKTHARGPVGLEGLLIYKYKLCGNGHVVNEFGEGKKKYLHEKINVFRDNLIYKY